MIAEGRLDPLPVGQRLGCASAILLFLISLGASAQANGKLQLHFMDVGQGDGAVLISPQGEVVLFDDGVANNCTKPVAYLQQLGITKIDYHIASHYHADHIGCASQVFAEFPLQKTAYDRGQSYNSSTYNDYISAVGQHRQTATQQTVIRLDASSAHPVTITIVALNGNGVSTTNENDLSVVATVDFGTFRAEFGGDLSGEETATYQDIETSVAPLVGRIDVYKVHHHCSSHSSNVTWLNTVRPRIGIISTGDGNTYGHPAQDCLDRLHAAGLKTYWTETGSGGAPSPGSDIVSGSIIVEISPGASTYAVTRSDQVVDTYQVWSSSPGGPPTPPAPSTGYAWSKRANVYHYATCRYVASISASNLERGTTPPLGKQLHAHCPQ